MSPLSESCFVSLPVYFSQASYLPSLLLCTNNIIQQIPCQSILFNRISSEIHSNKHLFPFPIIFSFVPVDIPARFRYTLLVVGVSWQLHLTTKTVSLPPFLEALLTAFSGGAICVTAPFFIQIMTNFRSADTIISKHSLLRLI